MSFVSEALLCAGAYIYVSGFFILGSVMLGLGLLGGIISYLYKVSILNAKEKRASDLFEVFKGFLIGTIRTINDSHAQYTKPDRTVH